MFIQIEERVNMKKLYVFVLSVVIIARCQAQFADSNKEYIALFSNTSVITGGSEKNNSIMGTVIDIVGRNPIEKAVVEIMGAGVKTTTSKIGQFKITNLEEGFYQIRASAEGYEAQTQNNLYVGGGKTGTSFFMLKKIGAADGSEYENSSPVPISTKSPNYPEEAKKNRIEGIFYFDVRISETGEITFARCGERNLFAEDGMLKNQQVIDKYPQAVNLMEKEALDALWQWKFKPAKKNRKPTQSSLILPIKFSLSKD
jgi:hypothetical protein